LPSSVPPRPAAARALAESRALRAALARASAAGRPFHVVHTAHLPAPRRLGVPFTLTLHDLKSVSPVERSALRRLTGRAVVADAVRRAARVLAVSAALGRELTERFGLPAERLALVPNGADHLTVLPRRPGAAMLYVGHVEPRKHLEVVVRALALDPDLPSLELAGAERGDEGRRLRALAAELGVGERLAFLGEQDDDDLARLYSAARCVVLPSRREGFGIPALEAQRAGAPLAIADLPALVEVAGEEVPRFDPWAPDAPAACARALRAALATDVAALERAAQRAARFTWDRSAAAWLEALVAAAGAAQQRGR
jgi:glycosyltransferase involved in cell wall biosynthesis